MLINQVKVLTTGGTIDKEYPQGVGGYAFEFGTITAAQRIKKRTHSKFEIERICSVDSQGLNVLLALKVMQFQMFLDMTHLERDVLVSRIRKDPSKIYIITHGTDTIIETARYISKKLHTGTILLIGAKLPEVFKDTDADFNLGFAIGAAKGMTRYNTVVFGCIRCL